jgi:tetratricopeptide (TPR) repeat protein
MNNAAESPTPTLSRFRLIAFRIAAILLPLAVLGLVEAGLRLFGDDQVVRDPLINVSPFTIFEKAKVDGREVYRISHPLAYNQVVKVFPVEKPANTIRIFSLGGSACAGWPHPPEETFSAYVENGLKEAYPGKRIEVINAAAHGFASYRITCVLAEVLRMQPDAVLIWCGNNEFLENRKYGRWIMAAERMGLNRLRLFQVVAGAFSTSRTVLPGNELKDAALFFWKKAQGQSLELRSDPQLFEAVKRHYADGMEDMVRRAEKQGVPVLLCTVPVNLRDWLPTVSRNRLKGAVRSEWEQRYAAGQRGLLEGKPAEAATAFRQALALEPEHAETHFWLARALETDGHRSEARESYSLARDLDFNPFRAISAFNQTIRRIAANRQGVTLVDLESLFDSASDRGIAGFDLFLDYVHPKKTGNLLVAASVFDALVKGGVLRDKTSVMTFPQPVASPAQPPYDETQDKNLQMTRFRLYAANRQYEAALEQARYITFLSTGQAVRPDAATLPDSEPADIRAIYLALFQYQAAQRRSWLDPGTDPAELAAAEQSLAACYRQWYPYGTY